MDKNNTKKQVQHLVVDTTAFIKNAPLQLVADKMYTVEEVVEEITNKKQLRRLCVLPYELEIKNVDPDNIKIISDFAKKTGDFQCLSATDIKVMALAYQMEKELVGTDHLRLEPIHQKTIKITTTKQKVGFDENIAGFCVPKKVSALPKTETVFVKKETEMKAKKILAELDQKFEDLDCNNMDPEKVKEILDIIENCDIDDEKLLEEQNISDYSGPWVVSPIVEIAKQFIKEEEENLKNGVEPSEFACSWASPSCIEIAQDFIRAAEGKYEVGVNQDQNNSFQLKNENKSLHLKNENKSFHLKKEMISNDNEDESNSNEDENNSNEDENQPNEEHETDDDDDDDEDSWITPSNVQKAKKMIQSECMDEKHVTVACMTTDFAMQNVLRQMNLNVSALDGRMIKHLKTYILRCYTCFNTTSIMTKQFCPKCGNNTLKRVSCSVDEFGKQQIHINARKPLTCKGKKYSLPTIKGGKYSKNPKLTEDQPMPHQKPTRMAKMKTNAMDDDYTAGFSPFAMHDVHSRSAQLRIRPGQEAKQWLGGNRGRPRN